MAMGHLTPPITGSDRCKQGIFGKSDGELMGCFRQVMGYGDSTKNGRFVEDHFQKRTERNSKNPTNAARSTRIYWLSTIPVIAPVLIT